jgi:IS1 family transposase
MGGRLMRRCFLRRRIGVLQRVQGRYVLERWHALVRPRLSRDVRRTLSFSKSLEMHELVTRWFVVAYNQSLSLNT